ncbi:hypothetical protein H5410_027149 [Solanum commersonii]|uniref:Uncharacterized protein n=1 Tax=Solanum commersonii TaxID=4109 RepID=A0A9J5YYF5_SOLCO|nr:hypothetical protein H5410_027149 [Solanum commersonii]
MVWTCEETVRRCPSEEVRGLGCRGYAEGQRHHEIPLVILLHKWLLPTLYKEGIMIIICTQAKYPTKTIKLCNEDTTNL